MRDMRHLCGIEVAVRGDLVHLEKLTDETGVVRHPGLCQAEPKGGSRGLIYIEIGTEIIEGLRG